MMPTEEISPLEPSDAALVAQARRGDRDAFGRIVARYQALVCALAYNATGGLARSEDLAQEAFVIAWQQLPALREPEKLRSWLCGIVRNLGRRARRGEKYEPVLRAEHLESVGELAAPEPHPLEQAISRDEEDILWKQLEAIPETYREPLILFYRQHASIEQVAVALELSEDAVRQRLSRGRKLLQEQVVAFVESALERTSPKPAFTQHVLAALPAAAAASGKAAGAVLAAASGAAAKGAWTVAGPIGGALAMVGGALVTRMGIAEGTKSSREREFVSRIAWLQLALGSLGLAGGWILARGWRAHTPLARDLEFFAFVFCLWAVNSRLWRWRAIRQRRIQIEDGTFDEAEWRPQPRGSGGAKPPPAAPPFSVLLKRSALSLVFGVIWAFRVPWRQHFVQALVAALVGLLVTFLLTWLAWRVGFKKRSRYRRPSLAFLIGFPAGITLLATNLDLFLARSRGGASISEVILLDAAIILAFSAWSLIFLRVPKRPLPQLV